MCNMGLFILTYHYNDSRLFVSIVLGFPIILMEETPTVVRGLDHSETESERRPSRDNFAVG